MEASSALPMADASFWSERKLACTAAAALVAVGLVTVPFGHVQLPANASFMPAFGVLTGFADLLTAVLLFSYAKGVNDQRTAYLGTAYLVSVLSIIPHLLSFPGAVAAAPVIGTSASAVWLWSVWHGGFALCVCRYALAAPGQELAGRWRMVAGSAAVVLALTVVATAGLPWLPVILVGGSFTSVILLGVGPLVVLSNLAALGLVLLRLRGDRIMSAWLAVAMLAATIDVTLTLFSGARFTLGWYVARCLSLATAMVVLVAMLSELLGLFRKSEALNRQLHVLSLTDALTGIANRRSFDATLDLEWRRAARGRTALSLLMIDVDFFKKYNDRYGHPAGDVCLRKVAKAIWRATRRAGDAVARVGGEEFAVLLPAIDPSGAAEVAQRIHAEIAALQIVHADSPTGCATISLGIATMFPSPAQHGPDLVAMADLALYRAKAAGRNRSEGVTAAVAATGLPVPMAVAT